MNEEIKIVGEGDEEEREKKGGKEDDEDERRTILICITDTHIGGHPLNFRRLRFILDHLLWYYSKETESRVVVVHCGDIVDKGKNDKLYKKCTSAFTNFSMKMKAALGEDNFRFFVCIGNHDLGSGVKSSSKFYKVFSDAVTPFCDNDPSFYIDTPNRGICQCLIEYGGINYILLNSNQESIGGSWAYGELGTKQLNWLDEVLEKRVKGRKTLIFLHHHPFKAKSGNIIIRSIMNSPHLHSLKDERQFTELLRKHKSKLLGVVFGHRHWREFCEVEGVNHFQKDEDEHREENASKPFLYSGGSTVNGPRMILQHKKVFDEFRFRPNKDGDTINFYERNRWDFKSFYMKSYKAKMFRTIVSERENGEVCGKAEQVLNITKRRFEDHRLVRPKRKPSGVKKEEEKTNSFDKYVRDVGQVVKEEEEDENEGEEDDEEEKGKSSIFGEFFSTQNMEEDD